MSHRCVRVHLIISQLLLIGVLLSMPSQAFPCTCYRHGPPCQDVWRTDAVFLGTVVDGRIDWLIRFFHELGSEVITFRVDDGVRGVRTGDVVRVHTTLSDCRFWFRRSQSYVVYADYDREQVLRTNSCSRTSLAREAMMDIEYFRALRAGRTPTKIYGFVTLDGDDLLFGSRVNATRPVAEVPIEAEQNGRVWSTVTRSDGSFSLADLPPGKFLVTAHLTNPLDPWDHNGTKRTVELPPGACAEEIFQAGGPQHKHEGKTEGKTGDRLQY